MQVGSRVLRDAGALRERLDQLDAPHVAPLNAYVRNLRNRLGGDHVPWFDPASAGVDAEVLLLLEAPGARSVSTDGLRARPGSGIISPDNDDMTAANTTRLRDAAGLDRTRLLHWNAIPWYIGDGTTIRPANEADRREALPELRTLLALLPKLRVVVTMGRAAQIIWAMHVQKESTGVVAVPALHPSPRSMNRWPDAWQRAQLSMVSARAVLDATAAPTGVRPPLGLLPGEDAGHAGGGPRSAARCRVPLGTQRRCNLPSGQTAVP